MTKYGYSACQTCQARSNLVLTYSKYWLLAILLATLLAQLCAALAAVLAHKIRSCHNSECSFHSFLLLQLIPGVLEILYPNTIPGSFKSLLSKILSLLSLGAM